MWSDFLCLAATTEDGRWRPGIGDPTLMGWFTVASYFLAAFFCWRAAEASRRILADRARQWFWLFCAVFLAGLGVNKQLDLQTFFTQFGRDIALQQGWYERRREVQMYFIAALLLVVAGGSIFLAFWWRRHFGRNYLPIAGVIFLAAFVFLRASSFHHIDALLGTRVKGFKMNWLFELSGIGMIAIGALQETIRTLYNTPARKTPAPARRVAPAR
jgi:hypothetical protein